jgi:menaquinol-cytochrome c reductase iron-sulfur subunit
MNDAVRGAVSGLGGAEETRRRLMARAIVGLLGVAGAVVSIPILAYLLSPLLNPAPNVWRDVGGVDDFRLGEMKLVDFEEPSPLPWAGQTARTAAWVRRTGPASFIAFGVNCTHLGCPVNWLAEAGIFVCPCHGGVYYADGRVAAGPPPRPLFRYDIRVQNGRVQILARPLQLR